MRVMFVSVKRTYEPGMSMSQLARCAEKAWPVTLPNARSCDRLVAVLDGLPLAAWELHGAYPTEETWDNGTRTRIGLVLGDPVPVLPAYHQNVPTLRRGVAVVDGI